MSNSTHLGDGAYATFTPYYIVLTANHHDPQQATDTVHIEPQGLQALVDMARSQGFQFGNDPETTKE